MNFHEYQALAARTSTANNVAISALGLAGEAGEVVDLLKKHLGHGHDLDKMKLAKELGDVLWYVSDLARQFDLSLDDIAVGNIEKLKKRYPDGFSQAASRNRVDAET